jgi:hypothetical protein
MPPSFYKDIGWKPSLGRYKSLFSRKQRDHSHRLCILDFVKIKLRHVIGDLLDNGNLYYFRLNDTRTGLKFNSLGLKDMVVDNMKELSGITFASGFKGITNIETGPDGYLYILSYLDGKMYRIVPS